MQGPMSEVGDICWLVWHMPLVCIPDLWMCNTEFWFASHGLRAWCMLKGFKSYPVYQSMFNKNVPINHICIRFSLFKVISDVFTKKHNFVGLFCCLAFWSAVFQVNQPCFFGFGWILAKNAMCSSHPTPSAGTSASSRGPAAVARRLVQRHLGWPGAVWWWGELGNMISLMTMIYWLLVLLTYCFSNIVERTWHSTLLADLLYIARGKNPEFILWKLAPKMKDVKNHRTAIDVSIFVEIQ